MIEAVNIKTARILGNAVIQIDEDKISVSSSYGKEEAAEWIAVVATPQAKIVVDDDFRIIKQMLPM